MRNSRVTLSMLASMLAGMLAGCGGSAQQEEPVEPVRDSAFGDLVRAEDKARSVEATTQQHKNDIDAAVQANEGAATP